MSTFKNLGLAAITSLQLASGYAADNDHGPHSPEIVQTFQQEKPTYTPADKYFLNKYKDNKDVKRKKIEFAPEYISIDGIKFARHPMQYNDIKDMEGINVNQNAYIHDKDSSMHFTYDAVNKLIKSGKKIPTVAQRESAVKALGGDCGLLCQLLNYPKMGMRTRNGAWANESSFQSRLADYREKNNDAAYVTCNDKSGTWNWSPILNARPLIFLHD